MFEKIRKFSDEKLKNFSLSDLKLLAWGCIFFGGYLSLSIIPLQNIHNTYYLLIAILFLIKPIYKVIFKPSKVKKKK